MDCRVALLSDIHFDAEACDFKERKCPRGKELFTEAVHYVNERVTPDLVLVLGDLVDAGDTEEGGRCLRELRPALDLVEAPVLAIPGNHDPAPECFYTVLESVPRWLDVGGVRFVPFVDPEAPEFNAQRPSEALARFAEARADFDGPIVSVQHVPLFQPGVCDCPYNYVNAEEILQAMRGAGVGCAISGHWHRGIAVSHADGFVSIVNPALCEPPFRFLEVMFSGAAVAVRDHALPEPERTH
jgi:3',5'-cyclic AMP phosphodiesterase CpdA